MNLDSAEPNHFTPAHLEQLQAFADQAAAAVHHARLYAQIQRHNTDLERRVNERTADLSLRNTIVETMSHSLDIAQILDEVLAVILERFSVCGGAIYLVDDDGAGLQAVACRGLPVETLNLVMGIGPVDSRLVPTPYLLDEAGDVMDAVQKTGIQASITVPIWQQERVEGVLTLVHDQPRPWPNEQAHMLDLIGRQIGVALSNARLYAKLAHEEAHLRTVLHSVTEGMMVFDRDLNLTLMNPAAEKLLTFYPAAQGGSTRAAYKLGEWIRWRERTAESVIEFALPTDPLVSGDGTAPIHKIGECHFPSRSDPAWPCWLQAGISDEESILSCPAHQRLITRAIQAQSAEIRTSDGEIRGRVIALHDVTYFRELDEMKRQFVSTVSHELRNPLAALLLQISSLHRYYDRFAEEERRRMVAQVQQHAYGLRELVEDILELSRFDAGRTLPQKEWFDLVDKCRSVINVMQPLIREKNQLFDAHYSAESCYFHADPNQITRVVRNLVENAIKYTPDSGQIKLKLEIQAAELHLSVTDTGIGIPSDKLVYIFDRFFRTDEASKMAPGSGLGLAITKQIVDLHGGRIVAQSVVGQGSTFTVTLPISHVMANVYPA
jgi:signal transduction histidine kinase/GAF domain-containing protein